MERTLMISGASRGIGRAIAERALAEGHRLSLGLRQPRDLDDHPLGARARSEPHRVLLQPYEAEDPASAAAWVAATVERFGGIEGVIHCAGIFSRVGLNFAPGEEAGIERLWRVNLMGPWWLTRAAWPALAAGGDGRVITLVSMSGKRVKGTLAAYGVSKFALMGLCQAMRNEGWAQGIRVTAVCPGWVNTEMAAAVSSLPQEAMTQPEDLAALVVPLLGRSASCVPFELAVNCVLES
ncbi:MAG: SDR family NAD(P)-dependent oxidoreductase [Synechococcaceae cyanobacterium]|nr:SDR family NAD(P)-dependent oxidoreductase [Synechococcaceae cyanobacterium]